MHIHRFCTLTQIHVCHLKLRHPKFRINFKSCSVLCICIIKAYASFSNIMQTYTLVTDNPSPYKLCKALRESTPPIFITDGLAKEWFRKYQGDLKDINNAGHLELQFGELIRAQEKELISDPKTLSIWMRQEHKVRVETRVCQHWMQTEWSTSGTLTTPQQVESQVGDRLRLPQYSTRFGDDTAAAALSQFLAESQPPVKIAPLLLRQWYVKHHPASGPLFTFNNVVS